jgi:hypothetical protein
VRWNLSVVLICISFMARDGEHFIMCFLVIWTSPFEKALFSPFLHGSLHFGEFSFLRSLYFEVISHLSDVYLAKASLPFSVYPLQFKGTEAF